MITHFVGEYEFLSNFYPVEVTFDGKAYPSVEHAFQAAKTDVETERQQIREASTPAQAKRLGRKASLRKDWETVKFTVMRSLLQQKFAQPVMRAKLAATGDAGLVEGNTWNDKIWGCVWNKGRWEGRNMLGKLLMEIRAAKD